MTVLSKSHSAGFRRRELSWTLMAAAAISCSPNEGTRPSASGVGSAGTSTSVAGRTAGAAAGSGGSPFSTGIAGSPGIAGQPAPAQPPPMKDGKSWWFNQDFSSF
jgi:hypothetical protein